MTEKNETTTEEQKGFATGEHVVLRPVLEDDLAGLAPLMASNPGEPDRLPWTTQRLKKKFEDEKEPGLWGKQSRMFVAVRKQGGELVGYLKQHKDENPGVYWCWLQVADGLADRAELVKDMVQAYQAFMLAWHDPLRISFDVLSYEEDKAAWLTECGYPLELRRERMVLWLGEPQAVCTHAWYSERLIAELAKREE